MEDKKTIELNALLELLDEMSIRNWCDETTLDVLFSEKEWSYLLSILKKNPKISEEKFSETAYCDL